MCDRSHDEKHSVKILSKFYREMLADLLSQKMEGQTDIKISSCLSIFNVFSLACSKCDIVKQSVCRLTVQAYSVCISTFQTVFVSYFYTFVGFPKILLNLIDRANFIADKMHTCHTSRIVRDMQSRILILCPSVMEIMKLSLNFKNMKSTDFIRSIECDGFIINSFYECCICCRVPIIGGIPVVIDRD